MSKGQLLLFAFVCAAFVWQEARSSPARVMGYNSLGRDAKIPRTIRAPFRNREMMTARGFGKRSQTIQNREGKWQVLRGNPSQSYTTSFTVESPWMISKNELDLDPVEQMVSGSSLESFPIDWFVDELISSPMLTKAVLSRFVDRNKDGLLSAQELIGQTQTRRTDGGVDNNDGFWMEKNCITVRDEILISKTYGQLKS